MDLTRVCSIHNHVNALQARIAYRIVTSSKPIFIISGAGTGKSRIAGFVTWLFLQLKEALVMGRITKEQFPDVSFVNKIYILSNSENATSNLEQEILKVIPDVAREPDVIMKSINAMRDPQLDDLIIVDEVSFSRSTSAELGERDRKLLSFSKARCIFINATPIWNDVSELCVPLRIIGQLDYTPTDVTPDIIHSILMDRVVYVPSQATSAFYMKADFTNKLNTLTEGVNYTFEKTLGQSHIVLPIMSLQKIVCDSLNAEGRKASGVETILPKALFSLDVETATGYEYEPRVVSALSRKMIGIMRPPGAASGLYMSDVSIALAFALNNERFKHRKTLFYLYYHATVKMAIEARMKQLDYKPLGDMPLQGERYYIWCDSTDISLQVSKVPDNISLFVFITGKSGQGMNYLGFRSTYVGGAEYNLASIEQIIARGIRLSRERNDHEIYNLYIVADGYDSVNDYRSGYVDTKILPITEAIDAMRDCSICQDLILAKVMTPLDSHTATRPKGKNADEVHICSTVEGRSLEFDIFKWAPVFTTVDVPVPDADVSRRCNADNLATSIITMFYNMSH